MIDSGAVPLMRHLEVGLARTEAGRPGRQTLKVGELGQQTSSIESPPARYSSIDFSSRSRTSQTSSGGLAVAVVRVDGRLKSNSVMPPAASMLQGMQVMAVQPSRKLLTVADYYQLAEAGALRDDVRVELIEGNLVEMPPIGPGHADAVDIVADLLVDASAGTHQNTEPVAPRCAHRSPARYRRCAIARGARPVVRRGAPNCCRHDPRR